MTLITSVTKSAGDTITAANNNAQRLDDLQMAGDYVSATGSSNAYAATLDSQMSGYVTGAKYKIKANFTNTGAATANINTWGARTIKKYGGTEDLEPGDVQNGQILELFDDGTNLQLAGGPGQNNSPSKFSATAGEAIDTSSAPKAVYLSGIDNKYYKCDGADISKLKFIGFDITGAASITNDTLDIRHGGVVGGFSGLTPDEPCYLWEDGGIRHYGSWIHRKKIIGIAISSTEILIQPETQIYHTILADHDWLGISTAAPVYSDDLDCWIFSDGSKNLEIIRWGQSTESRDVSSDWAAADNIYGLSKIDGYIYALLYDSGGTEYRVYRYDADDLSSGGTKMTYASFGSTAGVRMFSDGTYLYFTGDGGNTANLYDIRRLTISGITLVSASDFNLSTSPSSGNIGASRDFIYTYYSTDTLEKFDLSGVFVGSADMLGRDNDNLYTFGDINFIGAPGSGVSTNASILSQLPI